MRGWSMAVLERLRADEARQAGRRAAARWAEVSRARARVAELEERADDGRRKAGAGGELPRAASAAELVRRASSRWATDGAARRAAQDGRRAADEAGRALERAAAALTSVLELRGRADALARGRVRWEEGRRRSLEASREREVEDSWAGRPPG